MKSVALLLASAACLWAASGSSALDEANAGLRLAREGKYELPSRITGRPSPWTQTCPAFT
ncbi:MAG TPA: hypothetical protein VKF41_08525 [Bryobacteraceae bacterium]|nr:hypothetical protein [Bryobacteraceae bacterium]